MSLEFQDALLNWQNAKDVIARYEDNRIALRKKALSSAYDNVRETEKIKNKLCPHDRCQPYDYEEHDRDEYDSWSSTRYRSIRCLDCEQIILNSSGGGGYGYGFHYYKSINSTDPVPLIDLAEWWEKNRYVNKSGGYKNYPYELKDAGIRTITKVEKQYKMVDVPVTTYTKRV